MLFSDNLWGICIQHGVKRRNLKDVSSDDFTDQGKWAMSWWMTEVDFFPFLSLMIIICHKAYRNCGSAKTDDLLDIFNL